MIRFEKILALSRPLLRLSRRGLQKKPIEVKEPSKLDYFRSPSGRPTSFLAYICAGTALIQLTIIGPHRFLINQLRQIFTGSSPDTAASLSESFLNLISECIDENVKPLMVCGNCYSQPKSFGRSDQNVLLLIPDHFKYENIQQIEGFGDCKHGSLSEESKAAPIPQDALATVVLSEEAKRYAITREIIRSTKSYHSLHGIFAYLCLLSNYIMARVVNDRLQTFKLPLRHRLIFYTFTSIFNFYMFQTGSSALAASQESELVETVARTSESLARGGVEFYTKERDRNLAKKTLFPKEFEKKINSRGDKIKWNYTRSLPLDERIKICQNIIPLHQAGLN